METRHLGQTSALPASPEEAVLDYVPNPRPGALYLVRFAAPEFTSLCPVTGQPDFAHLVIDYAPGETIVEIKSLKLFLGSFRNQCGFHEDVTVGIGQRLVGGDEAAVAAHRRLLVPARRHADRRLLAVRPAAGGAVAARPGRSRLSRPWLTLGSRSWGRGRSAASSAAAGRARAWSPSSGGESFRIEIRQHGLTLSDYSGWQAHVGSGRLPHRSWRARRRGHHRLVP